MCQYLCQHQVDYVVDWPSFIDKFLIDRSAQWKDDNLTLVKQMGEVNIYAVNHANCLLTNKGSK
jgi:hypothetical protein